MKKERTDCAVQATYFALRRKALRIIPSPVKRIEGRCKKVSFNLLLLLVTKKDRSLHAYLI